MPSWVRFHAEIRQADKRGIPRAWRFVYMELSHEARARRGWIPLPVGMGDLAGVQDILGGNKREVAEAVNHYTSGSDPSLRFGEVDGKRAIIVLNWEKWNPKSDDSGPRVREWREKKAKSKPSGLDPGGNGYGNVSGHGTETVTVTPMKQDVTPRARALISSPLSPSELDPRDPDGSTDTAVTLRPVPSNPKLVTRSMPIPDELRAAAQMIGLQDIETSWLKFTGNYDGQLVPSVAGYWQRWAADDRKRERTSSVRKSAPLVQQEPPEGRHWKVGSDE